MSITNAEMVQFFGLTEPCTPGAHLNLQAICTDGTYSFGGEMVDEVSLHLGGKKAVKADGCGGCAEGVAAKIAMIEKWQAGWGAESLLELARILFPK